MLKVFYNTKIKTTNLENNFGKKTFNKFIYEEAPLHDLHLPGDSNRGVLKNSHSIKYNVKMKEG